MRRIPVDEAIVTEIAAECNNVLSRHGVELSLRVMGKSISAQTAASERLDATAIGVGTRRIKHLDAVGIDVQIVSLRRIHNVGQFTLPG